ncbi:cytochrome P450 [Mycobacterium antarcticum]|uniref:cytochrome P450 n=1 Tax=Mycolicibacterium sp. TUM20985 TaxID=3023370 RepID=UPI0025730EEA|nr:cytochrome P450 [Mycolicibacterium sp. TUM20985]BDX33675.1 cytochrome P450 [Mycolicibacterium sp. TUM20985]
MTKALTAANRPYSDIDISSIAFWGQPPEVRDETFAVLRERGGVSWHPPVEAQPVEPQSPGFWAATTHAVVTEVSSDWQRFSSAGTSPSVYEFDPEMMATSTSFAPMDPPQHTRYRRLVSKAFSPGQLRRIESLIAQHAKVAVDGLLERGPCDFVQAVSNYVPSHVIADMVGFEDDKLRTVVLKSVTKILAFGDPDVRDGQDTIEFFAHTLLDLHSAGYAHLDERRSNPSDDLMTALINAEVDGERLADQEIVSFFTTLVTAGIDTTLNTMTFGLRALTQFPDQRALLLSDMPRHMGPAVVEMARWTTPVSSFVRRATEDTELAGVPIAEGDRVALWYRSANRDETMFDNAAAFDILRDNTRQVAWGAGGPHYCLGVNLSKVELSHVFTELLTRIPTIRAVGEAKYASSPMVNSIEHQFCEWD